MRQVTIYVPTRYGGIIIIYTINVLALHVAPTRCGINFLILFIITNVLYFVPTRYGINMSKTWQPTTYINEYFRRYSDGCGFTYINERSAHTQIVCLIQNKMHFHARYYMYIIYYIRM